MDDKGKKMIDAILPKGATASPKKEKSKRSKSDMSGKKQIVNKKALKWIIKDEDYHPSYSDNKLRFIRNLTRWFVRGALIIGIVLIVMVVSSSIVDFVTWVKSWR